MIRFFTVSFLLLLGEATFSQALKMPSDLSRRTNKDDLHLIDSIRFKCSEEKSKLTLKTLFYRPYMDQTRDALIDQVREGGFVINDSLNNLVDSVAKRILDANQLEISSPVFLISNSAYPNASSSMINVFEVSIGLLTLVENLDELAVVVGHEMAHMNSYHHAERIVLEMELNPDAEMNDEIRRIAKGKSSLTGLEKAQESRYRLMSSMRNMELVADSIGIHYAMNAGFDVSKGAYVLNYLGYDGFSTPDNVVQLFSSLFSASFPPNMRWFEDRLPVHNRLPDYLLFYKTDSLLTHPHKQHRYDQLKEVVSINTNSEYQWTVSPSWKDFIWAAYSSKALDVTLFLSLVYAREYGYDAFIASIVSASFMDLYQAKYDNVPKNNIYQYVSYNTTFHTPQLRQINTILHHMTKEDCLMAGYMFLNNSSIFNSACEDHYQLLFQYASVLNKDDIAEKVATMYHLKFPEGKYKRSDFK